MRTLRFSSESALKHPIGFYKHALSDLRRSLDTAYRLFQRNLALRYRYSSLGIIWAVFPAIVISAIITIGHRTRMTVVTDNSVPPQFYAVYGLMMAQTFLEAMNIQRILFAANRQQLSRRACPIEGFVLAGFGECAFGLVVKIPVLAAVFAICHMNLAPTWIFGLIGFLVILLLGTAVGLLLAPISSLKGDMENIMLFLPWILFAISPVFVAAKRGTTLWNIYRCNPLSSLFDSTREAGYGPAASLHFITLIGEWFALSCALIVASWTLCRVARPYVVERYLL